MCDDDSQPGSASEPDSEAAVTTTDSPPIPPTPEARTKAVPRPRNTSLGDESRPAVTTRVRD